MKRQGRKPYFKHKVENLIHITKIVTVHYFNLRPHFTSIGESHDFWEMVYADRNSVICTRDGEDIVLNEGEAIFHKPYEHHIHKTRDDGASIFIISFVSKSPSIDFFSGKVVKLEKDLLKFIYMIIEESRNTFDPSTYMTNSMTLLPHPALGGLQMIKNITEAMLISVMREGEVDEAEPSFIVKEDYDEYIAGEVIDYLQKNVYGKVTIEDICHKLNYTRSYLFRQFKSVTGKSIMSYFTQLKIKEAKRLLIETDISIAEISEKLSFDTPNYFGKTFKRVAGYTPLKYRTLKRMQLM